MLARAFPVTSISTTIHVAKLVDDLVSIAGFAPYCEKFKK